MSGAIDCLSLSQPACEFSRVPLEKACGEAAATFRDVATGLVCVNGTCTATGDGEVPGAGKACDRPLCIPCAPEVEQEMGAMLSCRNTSFLGLGRCACGCDRQATSAVQRTTQ